MKDRFARSWPWRCRRGRVRRGQGKGTAPRAHAGPLEASERPSAGSPRATWDVATGEACRVRLTRSRSRRLGAAGAPRPRSGATSAARGSARARRRAQRQRVDAHAERRERVSDSARERRLARRRRLAAPFCQQRERARVTSCRIRSRRSDARASVVLKRSLTRRRRVVGSASNSARRVPSRRRPASGPDERRVTTRRSRGTRRSPQRDRPVRVSTWRRPSRRWSRSGRADTAALVRHEAGVARLIGRRRLDRAAAVGERDRLADRHHGLAAEPAHRTPVELQGRCRNRSARRRPPAAARATRAPRAPPPTAEQRARPL